jgi:ATP-binding cassette subfamily B protein
MTKAKKGVKRLSILRELGQFAKPYKGTLIAAGIALIFTAAITLSMGQGVRILIDDGFGSGSKELLNQAVVILLALSLLMAAGTFVRFYLVSWLGERISADIRDAVFSNVISLHPSYFEENRSGEIMSRLTTDTTLLQTIIGSSFSMALRSSLTLVGAMIMLFVTNLKLTAMVLATVPLVLMPIILYGRKVRNLSNQSQDSIASVGSYAGEIIQHIKTVQSYTREGFERQAFSDEVERAFIIARRRIRQRAVLITVVIMLVFTGLSAMFWVGGNDVFDGTMTGGELAAFVFYALMVGTGVATVSEVWGELMRAAGATERLMELLHEQSLIGDDSETAANFDFKAPVSVHNLSFAYPSRPSQPALQQLELRLESGKSLALVGPSGAGKSTLFELLQRFYDPQQGHIQIGNTDIRNIPLQELRHHIAVVPQAPALFTADVSYNIGYGKPGASQQEIENAARAAHAHDFTQRLPEGYASHLGEMGVRLSGGQKQRLAIARAILKDPEILLLDEATSALDAESEFQVQQALQELMKNRTTIIIAHRLSTILHADQIAVLDQGRLIATGSHQSLLQDCELYERLASLQFGAEP